MLCWICTEHALLSYMFIVNFLDLY
uniref:Uncharacterized protein n=1 Tax=Arundo donax TaxID=35708 RepID=A0A0A9AUF6_ARUDO